MKIIKTKHFPFGNYSTINLFGILFTKQTEIGITTLRHEAIHTAQMKELLYIFFYLLIRAFHKKQNSAYHDVSFEEEAHLNDTNPEYLSKRRKYAWIQYVKLKSNQ